MAPPDRSALRSTSTHVLVDGDLFDDAGVVSLDDATAHHLRRVLRLRDGEAVSVTDGAGRWGLAVVVVDGKSLRLEATSEVVTEPDSPRSVTIAAAMPKGDRLDWMVQKVTELGIDRLVLLHADRSVVRWKPDRVEQQLARLQRVADEALRQSRRVVRLTIDAPRRAVDVLGDYVVAEPGGRSLTARDTSVAVGPEGGWSDAELEVSSDRIGLGPTILRTETAVMAISTLCVTFER
jgi:16S rRNA (uracil1498-N3)-methyltransferase